MSRARDFANLARVSSELETVAPIVDDIALDSEVATAAQGILADSAIQPNSSPTLDELLASNYKNTVYTLAGTEIDPANGNIQVKDFGSDNITLTEVLQNGESVVLILTGTGAVTFPTITWKGGEAPSLESPGSNILVLIKEDTTLYGSFAGVFS